jgi:hypothetical protein
MPASDMQKCAGHVRYFPQGRCHYGEQCRFKHESAPGRALLPLPGGGPVGATLSGARGTLSGANSVALLHPTLSDSLVSPSALHQRLALGAGSPLQSGNLLTSSMGAGLGNRLDLLGGPRGSSDLESAQRNGFLSYASSGAAGDLLLGNVRI